ncbi:MAG: TIM barrel protein [Pseudomonadota bacterium]
MTYPKLACPNLFSDVGILKSFALDHGFQGIDWTLRPEDLPKNEWEEARLTNAAARLAPLEVRYHLFFRGIELGNTDPEGAGTARETYFRALRVISGLSGRFATVHLGLGRDSMEGISWEKTLTGLADLAGAARDMGIRVCLENLVWGWTARPELYEKLLRKTGCWGTLDVGHAYVCDSVVSGAYDMDDFTLPHPTRIHNAHIYHEETADGHIPPAHYTDLEQRLRLLRTLPLCDWWVLELREEQALLQTLACVKEFLTVNAARKAM